MLPFVSGMCPTYNRYPDYGHLLEEAVESFLRQDYPANRRELIVWNDTPGQTIVCNAPGVVVVNTDVRFRSCGEKRNALVGLARGDILLPWDDDDISLPHRMRQAVQRLCVREEWASQKTLYGYWNPRHYWFRYHTLQVPTSLGYGHNCSAYTREAFHAAGGYPPGFGDEDAQMDHRLRETLGAGLVTESLNLLPPTEWSYIYRWGVSPCHLSGRADLPKQYDDIGKRPIVKGRYTIEPKWALDYAQEADEMAKKVPS